MTKRRSANLMAVTASCALSACSWGSYIGRSSVDYNGAVEAITNNLLVTNILRGRDNAPLFFSDVSQIRGSLSIAATAQAGWPFGPFRQDIGRTNSAQLGPLGVTTNPTFDIAPLNTKAFAEGINEPVSLNLMWYYLQRIDPGIILPLFISRMKTWKPWIRLLAARGSCGQPG